MPDDFDYSLPRKALARPQSADQPIITMLLIVLSVAFTAALWYSDYDKTSAMRGIANIGVVSAEDIWNGKYWGLITSMFPHANFVHILFNMIWTWQLGSAIEKELHPVSYLLFIVAAAVMGSAVQLCISGDMGIGMSGVVYAMFGLMWAGRGSFISWRGLASRENLNLFVGWGVLCIITTYMHIMSIGNGAHAGGFLFGLSVGYLWYAPRKRQIFAAPLALLGIATVMAVTWMPWSGGWQWWRGNRDLRSKHPLAAIYHYNTSIKLIGAQEGLLQNIVISWTDVLENAILTGNNADIQRATAERDKAKAEFAAFNASHRPGPAVGGKAADNSAAGEK